MAETEQPWYVQADVCAAAEEFAAPRFPRGGDPAAILGFLRGSLRTAGTRPPWEQPLAANFSGQIGKLAEGIQAFPADPVRVAALLRREVTGPRTGEHVTWFDEAEQRFWKMTHDGQFGIIPDLSVTLDKLTQAFVERFTLRTAAPGEYLARLAESNRLFGDTVRVEGLVRGDESPRIVTSQRFIRGDAPSRADVRATMREAGYQPVRDDGRDVPGLTPLFYRPSDNTLLFDAGVRNFVQSRDGLAVIDIGIMHPHGPLRALVRSRSSGEDSGRDIRLGQL